MCMKLLSSMAVVAVCIAGCSPAPAPEQGAAVDTAPVEATSASAYQMPDSEVLRIDSPVLNRSYEVFVRSPPGYAEAENSARKYPVVYLNDAHSTFQIAAGVTGSPMRHGGFEPMIIVGVSYGLEDVGAASRNRDLTPTRNPNSENITGGARDYLTFMRDEVIPLVEKTYRADPQRRILAGQSYGGLFGAFALLEEPGLFADYILTSSSLWYDSGVMFRLEDEAAKTGRELKGRVYFAIGETETPTIGNGRYDMVGDQKRFADLLRSRGHAALDVRDTVVEGGTHLTTFPIGLLRGLMWLAPGPKPYGG